MLLKSKVSIIRCNDYDPAGVKRSIKEALDLIGGINTFVKKGQKVLIKPNLLSARLPEEAVDTHPEFVRAVASLVKAAGAIPAIGDSPGSFFTIKSIDEVYEKSGVKKVADEEGIELLRFDKALHIDGYHIASAVKEYDLIINLPKLKTHTLAILTGAIKNTYGLVPGLSKVQHHKDAPHMKDFSRVIVDIFSITRPGLTIMDGIVGMDKNGPAAGRIRNIGLILASADAVSVDAVFADIAGLDYSNNLVLKEATERGLGKGRLEDIDVVGVGLGPARIKDFKLPQTALAYKFPAAIAKYIARLIDFRPVIDGARCKKCNICKTACPNDAITINKNISKIDEIKCIRCFCCHEVCPHDCIYIKKNFLTSLMWR